MRPNHARIAVLDGPLRIVISGGTGQLGTILARHFCENGHQVATISRFPKPQDWTTVHWDGTTLGPWTELIDGADVVINLAGRSVNCRYHGKNRHQILTSRTITTGLIGQAIAKACRPPALWLNASTATIYRHSLDRAMDEETGEIGTTNDAPASWRFSTDVAQAWERALFHAPIASTTRRIAMRAAMVMSPDTGGVFDAFLRLVRWGLGGSAGSGRQYVSWIHNVDYVRAIEFLIAHPELEGPVNICSPEPVPNREFMACLRHAWCTSYFGLPAREWMLAIGAQLLRTETELVLKSRRVVPGRLVKSGFEFHFPHWRAAAQDLVHRWRMLHADETQNLLC